MSKHRGVFNGWAVQICRNMHNIIIIMFERYYGVLAQMNVTSMQTESGN
jgi:hypothetical protein